MQVSLGTWHAVVPDENQERMRLIGAKLIQLESEKPGLVRMTSNPFMVPHAVAKLEMAGFRKRFLSAGNQFVYDVFLSYQEATQLLLPFKQTGQRTVRDRRSAPNSAVKKVADLTLATAD